MTARGTDSPPFELAPRPGAASPPSGDPGGTCAPASAGPSKLTETPFDVAAVFDLKGSQTGAEHLAPGDNDDVESRRDLVMTEHFSNQAFRSISLDRAPKALGGGDPQPANRQLVRQNEHRGETAVNPGATLVNLLKIGATADVFVSQEVSDHLLAADRQTLPSLGAPALEDETSVLRAHADQKTVCPLAVPIVGLERALSLHPR
jgi:hypothetical protein